MDFISNIVNAVNGFVWGPVMLVLLVGTGIYLTCRTHFLQVRKFGFMWKNTLGSLFGKRRKAAKKDHGANVSPFQAVTTALASTVGVGNVAGVAGAIVAGGPGAIVWMWISAFFGMVTKYSEIVLAVKFRKVDEKGVHYGGPMYYITNGLGKNWKWLAVLFALFGGLASFGIGNATQAAEISVAVNNLTGSGFDSSVITGIVLAVVVAFVVIGGIKSIGKVTSYFVPVMAVFYIVGGLVIIFMNITAIPAAFAAIFESAFSFEAVGGGILGYGIMRAMQNGFARGVFSNEAGLGSAPIAHAASSETEPVKQGLWGIFEVFIDTIVICTISGLVVVISGVYQNTTLTGGALTAAAFDGVLPGVGGTFVRVALIMFALSTILGWSYYGERCWGYLSNNNKAVNIIYKVVFIALVFVGAISSSSNVLEDTTALNFVWDVADTLNGMMAIPNLIALLGLSGVVAKTTREYFKDKKDQNAPFPEEA